MRKHIVVIVFVLLSLLFTIDSFSQSKSKAAKTKADENIARLLKELNNSSEDLQRMNILLELSKIYRNPSQVL